MIVETEIEISEGAWGSEITFADSQDYVGKIIHLSESSEVELNSDISRTILMLTGQVDIETEVEDRIIYLPIANGAAYHMTPGTVCRLRADAESTIISIEGKCSL